jgi:hypothetical protein
MGDPMSEPEARTSVVAGREHPVDRAEHARVPALSAEDSSRVAGTLSLLADRIRARILYALDLVELGVGDIAPALDATVDPAGYRPAPDFPQPKRQDCLRLLVDLSRSGEDVEEGE